MHSIVTFRYVFRTTNGIRWRRAAVDFKSRLTSIIKWTPSRSTGKENDDLLAAFISVVAIVPIAHRQWEGNRTIFKVCIGTKGTIMDWLNVTLQVNNQSISQKMAFRNRLSIFYSTYQWLALEGYLQRSWLTFYHLVRLTQQFIHAGRFGYAVAVCKSCYKGQYMLHIPWWRHQASDVMQCTIYKSLEYLLPQI